MSRIANVIRMATSHGVVDFNNQQEVQITKTKGSIQWKKPTLDQQAIRTNNHTRATFVKELCKQMGCSEIVKDKLEKMLVTNSGKPLTLSTAKKAVNLATRSKVHEAVGNFNSFFRKARALIGFHSRALFSDQKACAYFANMGKTEIHKANQSGAKPMEWKENVKIDPLTVSMANSEIPRRDELTKHKQAMIDHAINSFKSVPDHSLIKNPAMIRVNDDVKGMSVEIDHILEGGGKKDCTDLKTALNLPKAFWQSDPVLPNKVMIDFLKLPSHKSAAGEFGLEIPTRPTDILVREEHAGKVKDFLKENLTQEQFQELKDRIHFLKQMVDLSLAKMKPNPEQLLLDDWQKQGAMVKLLSGSSLSLLGINDQAAGHLLETAMTSAIPRVKTAVVGLCLNFALIFE